MGVELSTSEKLQVLQVAIMLGGDAPPEDRIKTVLELLGRPELWPKNPPSGPGFVPFRV